MTAPQPDLDRKPARSETLRRALAVGLVSILAAGCGMTSPNGQMRPSANAVERPAAAPAAAPQQAQAPKPEDDPNKPVPSPYRWNGSAERVVEGAPNASEAGASTAAAGGAAAPVFRGKTVMVEAGDTLNSIARRHGTTVAALKQINGLKGNNLQAGQMLVIPTAAP